MEARTEPPGRTSKASFRLFCRRKSALSSAGNTEDAETFRGPATGDPGHREGEEPVSGPPACTVTKSFSLFSLLRRNGTRIALGQRSRGLRGWIGGWRWRRRPPPRVGSTDISMDVQHVAEDAEGVDETPSRAEVPREDVTPTLEPSTPPAPTPWAGTPAPEVLRGSAGDSGRGLSSQVQVGTESAGASPVRLRPGERVGATPDSPGRLIPTPVPTPTATPPPDRSSADPPSEERLSAIFTDVTSLKSFDSLTGCGDVIADAEDDPANPGGAPGLSAGVSAAEKCSPARSPLALKASAKSPVSPYAPPRHRACPPPKAPQGSGVVAYMGGGEEMASPEGVDDADMRGLWHMLPRGGGGGDADGIASHLQPRPDDRPAQVKGLRLSKIPTSGRSGKQHTRPSPSPVDKDLLDVPPNDEGYWDSATPGPEDENSGILQRLPRESCSGDALYDLYDLDSPGAVASDDSDAAAVSPSLLGRKASPRPRNTAAAASSPSYPPAKGGAGLPGDSRIPVAVRSGPPPPHSSSQGELSSPVGPTPAKPNTPSRTRIPVSRVPVRPAANRGAKATPNKK